MATSAAAPSGALTRRAASVNAIDLSVARFIWFFSSDPSATESLHACAAVIICTLARQQRPLSEASDDCEIQRDLKRASVRLNYS